MADKNAAMIIIIIIATLSVTALRNISPNYPFCLFVCPVGLSKDNKSRLWRVDTLADLIFASEDKQYMAIQRCINKISTYIPIW